MHVSKQSLLLPKLNMMERGLFQVAKVDQVTCTQVTSSA